ncbi:MAG: portal protein [Chloroflexi bacterium HGW-Chloroflexi-9]|nr:MAG: portal protein [Chloroflexi bacterium HGW-Chloroflexi-9]
MRSEGTRERHEVIVIGGGQAGLATGYFLARRGVDFVILDANARTGDTWRNRWDSLRLFTPAVHDGLPGLPFPAAANAFPTKDEMADYLEAYVRRFDLPVRHGMAVEGLTAEDGHYVVTAGGQDLEAEQVVVATGAYPTARVPAFAPELAPGIRQLTAAEYRNAGQLLDGGVLVVGAGNSGAEIAMEAAAGHQTWLSGRGTGQVPAPVYAANGRFFWWFASHILTRNTPIGRKALAKIESGGGPLIRLRMADVVAAGVERVSRTVGVRDGRPLLDDGRVLDVSNVVWATGFVADYSWIRLPGFGDDGTVTHERGVVTGSPGLYFVGLPFQSGFTSAFIGGVERDARRIVDVLAAARHPRGTPHPATAAGE